MTTTLPTETVSKLAIKFREMAAGLQKEIDQRNGPRLENTPKRAREAASQREEGRHLEQVQSVLIGLAEAYEQDRVPPCLLGVTTKKQIDTLVRGGSWFSNDDNEMRASLLALCDPNAGQVTPQDKIREIERGLVVRKIDGFFPTPRDLVVSMLQYAGDLTGKAVLEPSAGKGNIADLVREWYPSARLDVIEWNMSLRDILTLKGHAVIGSDCLEHTTPAYDAILMNPPFEKMADIDHVLHCYNMLLKNGGRLVGIMSESTFFRQDKKTTAFREWLEERDAVVVKLDAGAFAESGTNVATRMIVVDKPASDDRAIEPTPASEPESIELPQTDTIALGDTMITDTPAVMDSLVDTPVRPMALSVLQENLSKALNSVLKAIDPRPVLPVLGNIYLEAHDSVLYVAASNLRLSISVAIGAKVDAPGRITLPAKTLADLVARLDKERVDLTLDEASSTVTLTCGSTVSNIKGIASTEYPDIKRSTNPGITVRAAVLKEMITHTAFAAAKEDNRPILTGVYFRVETDVLTLAAADGYRLAVRTTRLDETADTVMEMVVPATSLRELVRFLGDDTPVQIAWAKLPLNIVTFRVGHAEVSSQILEGRFPDFAAIVPKKWTTQIVVDAQAWRDAARVADIFADAHSGRMVIDPFKGEMIMAGRSAERGHADNRVTVKSDGGQPLDLHFDIRFLIEVLNVIDEDIVVFQSNGSDSPGVIRPQGRDDFVHVIMPMTK